MTHSHDHNHDHGAYDEHGNPEDLAAYLERLDDPERDAWQKPDEVLTVLGLKPGDTAAEIGSGSGYFVFRMARAVGEDGRVYAVEVDLRMAEVFLHRLEDSELRNVTPVMGLADNPLLPAASCDRILVVNTFHHLPEPVGYLRHLARALAPDGRILNVDFAPGDLEIGPPEDHKIAPETFEGYAHEAGLKVIGVDVDRLAYQYLIELSP